MADFVARYSGGKGAGSRPKRRPRARSPKPRRQGGHARPHARSGRTPRPVRAALARRRDGSDAQLDRALELDARRRELLPEVEGLKAQQNAASAGDRGGEAGGRGRGGRDRRACRRSRAAARRCARSSTASRPTSTRRSRCCPTRPTRPRPTRTRSSTSAASRAGPASTTWSSRAPGSTWRRARAWPARASPTSRATSCCSSWRSCAGRSRCSAARASTPVVPPVLVREEALFGTGFLPDTEQQIYRLADDALYLAGTSEVPLASLHAGEIARRAGCRCATRASRPASGARRAPRGATRAGCSASTSSTRSRCSRSWRPRTRWTSTSGCSRTRRRSSPRSASPTAWSTSASPSSARPRPRSTTARRGCPARSASAS